MVDDGAGKTINQELLLSYEPDFVICSADLEEQVKTAEFLRKQGVPAAVFHVEEFQEYLDMLNRHIVDGIISGVHSLEIEEYQKIKKPIVALDRYLGADIPVVAVNHEKGGRMAAEELAGSGCRWCCTLEAIRRRIPLS